MYQASIRDKKKHKIFHQQRSDNYEINTDYEELAYVKKLLGNCRLELISASGKETIGVIRGKLRKFNTRVIIEAGDIVVISKRDFQTNKVDIVHKYNPDQIQLLISEEKLSQLFLYLYNNTHTQQAEDNNEITENYINFVQHDSEENIESGEIGRAHV